MKMISKWGFFVSFGAILTFGVTTPSHALKIIPHFTKGPAAATNVFLNGPKPILPGSDRGANTPSTADDTGTDCNAILLADRFSTETGAVCEAIAQWEAVIKDDITLNMEFHGRTDLTFPAYASFPLFIMRSPNLDGAGYTGATHVLKLDENREKDALNAQRHLPSYDNLHVYTPSFRPQNWKPQSVWLSYANYKALGLDVESLTDVNLGGTLSHLDGLVVTNSRQSQVRGDYDIRDRYDAVVGPINTLFNYENNVAIFTANPARKTFDYTSVITHEIGHALGFTSNEAMVSDGSMFSFPAEMQGITTLDLFRFSEEDIKGANSDVKNWGKYQKTPRQLAIRENTPISNNVPIEPEKGNHVVVYQLHPTKGLQYIPMAGGGSNNGLGDGTPSDHSRSAFVVVRNPNNAITAYKWLEDRCPVNSLNCDPVVGDPNHHPHGRVMDPLSIVYIAPLIAFSDAVALDLIGYDIDYAKLPSGIFTGVIGEPNSPRDEKFSTQDLKMLFGVGLSETAHTIKENSVDEELPPESSE